ncbi:MAG: prepilin-type N-terminal cleavage/methylation domain-containing protein [Oscillospiraceae bacterium]|nr:prepilin-type N-terminal cleavage/methylation domain-containing protein [Oscillospiraceae bacterium]
MKKKGFTLIELIVVIAIIGVLAAILVPAMLGYVRKSKITTANTTAKSIYNAISVTLVDMDTTDQALPTTGANNVQPKGNSAWNGSGGDYFQNAVYAYFNDIAKVKEFSYEIVNGACTATGVLNGTYPGAYPKAWDPTMYKAAGSVADSATAMANAQYGGEEKKS